MEAEFANVCSADSSAFVLGGPRGQRAVCPTKVCAKQPGNARDIASEKWRILNFGQIWAQNCNFYKVPRESLDHVSDPKPQPRAPAGVAGAAGRAKSRSGNSPSENRPWVAFFSPSDLQIEFFSPFSSFSSLARRSAAQTSPCDHPLEPEGSGACSRQHASARSRAGKKSRRRNRRELERSAN